MDKDARIADLEAELTALKDRHQNLIDVLIHRSGGPVLHPETKDELTRATLEWAVTLKPPQV